jgi:hypothetical protein
MLLKSTKANQTLEKSMKSKRELLALYVLIEKNQWRRLYPESFYQSDGFLSPEKTKYVGLIYEIFLTIMGNSKRNLIEDEFNLIYMDIEYKSKSEKLSNAILSAIQERLGLKKQYLSEIEALANEAESIFPIDSPVILPIKFRLESTTYLVRLFAYGLFTGNNMMFERISEVFDLDRLQSATKLEDKHDLDNTLKFLYKGLIQKTDGGRQGSRRAAHQTLMLLREWYPNNDYVNWCIDHIEKYV